MPHERSTSPEHPTVWGADVAYLIVHDQAMRDGNAIGVVAILGVTYTGEYEPIKELAAALDDLPERTGHDVPLHVHGATAEWWHRSFRPIWSGTSALRGFTRSTPQDTSTGWCTPAWDG